MSWPRSTRAGFLQKCPDSAPGKFKIPRHVAFMKGCVVLKQFRQKTVVLCCLPSHLYPIRQGRTVGTFSEIRSFRPTLSTVHHEILMLAQVAGSSCLPRLCVHIQYCLRHRPRVWDISRVVLYYNSH